MARTKQTAKKTTGIEAPRVILKIPRPKAALQRPVVKIRPTSNAASSPASLALDQLNSVATSRDSSNEDGNAGNNDFCHICGDGGHLYSCDRCPRAACIKCIPVPDKYAALVGESAAKFVCVTCHWKGDSRSGQVNPYMGFYRDGQPILDTFLPIPGSFHFPIHSMINSRKTILIHLRVHTINSGGPTAMLDHFFPPFFTHSGELVVKNLAFNLTTNAMITQYQQEATAVATELGNVGNCEVLFTVLAHSDEDRGDLTTGFSRQRKREVSSTVASVLDVLLMPFEKITPGAMVILLACGSVVNKAESFNELYQSIKRFQFSTAIAFDADRLHPTSCWPFIVILCEAILIEGHKLDTAIPHALANSNKLNLHSGVYAFSQIAGSLLVTKYFWSHRDFRPWGTVLPIQCSQCGTTQQWKRRVEENVKGQDGVLYVFDCRYDKCGQDPLTGQAVSPRGKIIARKPKGVTLIPQGSTKCSGWLRLQVVP